MDLLFKKALHYKHNRLICSAPQHYLYLKQFYWLEIIVHKIKQKA